MRGNRVEKFCGEEWELAASESLTAGTVQQRPLSRATVDHTTDVWSLQVGTGSPNKQRQPQSIAASETIRHCGKFVIFLG
jgi:hypothetical protein